MCQRNARESRGIDGNRAGSIKKSSIRHAKIFAGRSKGPVALMPFAEKIMMSSIKIAHRSVFETFGLAGQIPE